MMSIETVKNYLVIWLAILPFAGYTQAQKRNTDSIVSVRMKVIVDNDFGGDPDGLFQLAHQLLSPSAEVRGIIGSKQYAGGFYGYPGDADYSCRVARDLLASMHLEAQYKVVPGASDELPDTSTPIRSEAAQLIVREAMKAETGSPLYILCGAGLGNIASAFLMEPKIADKIVLVWIGGTEYEGLASPPPGASKKWEYNTGIDAKACQVIFNQSNINIWQVPRNAYRQALCSYSELLDQVAPQGELGKFLVERIEDLLKRADRKLGEAYVLGDSPLVLLTALQSGWEADASSSRYVMKPAPSVSAEGLFTETLTGRMIRVYDQLDTRLMFADLFAKLRLQAR